MTDPILARLNPSSYRRTPWKNGGGITVDIAGAYRAGVEPGGWAGVLWRLGRTRIETPGPFSDLTGHDRILTVIDGGGLVLKPRDRPPIDARTPFRPVSFPGEWPIETALEQGGVGVLNLIWDRRFGSGCVRFPAPDEAMALAGDTNILYAPAATARFALAGREEVLDQDHALRVAQGTALRLMDGVLAVASVTPSVA